MRAPAIVLLGLLLGPACETPCAKCDSEPVDDTGDGLGCEGGDPFAAEVCNGADDDCDGLVDDDDPGLDESTTQAWYPDQDGDGYGEDEGVITACDQPYANSVTEGGDCDDDEPQVNPDASEVCDGEDDDCDGLVDGEDPDLDDAGAVEGYLDGDGDGYGDPDTFGPACPEDGRVEEGADCDDADPEVHPGAVEVCEDGVDQDCDEADPACAGVFGEVDPDAAAAALIVGDESSSDFGDGATALDWNGDGVTDVAVGAPLSNDGAEEAGAVFIYLGPFTGPLDQHDDAAVEITSAEVRKYMGGAVRRVPDLDEDGDDELFIYGSSSTNRGVVEGGSVSGLVSIVDAAPVEVSCGPIFDLGDYDEDGTADWVYGASSGVYVISGFEVDEPRVSIGTGDSLDSFGSALDGAEDLDGDGVADLWVGARGVTISEGNEGGAWLLPGPFADETVSPDSATARGTTRNQELGDSVAAADVDGDGYADLFAGTSQDDGAASDAGAWYGWMGPVSAGVTDLDADIVIMGTEEDQKLGDGPGLGRDVDGDGRDDLLLVAFRTNAEGSDTDTSDGAAWLFYGPLSGSLALADACDTGACLRGETEDHLGTSASWADDLTGDGVVDLLITASYATWDEGGAPTERGGLIYMLSGAL